MSRTPIKKDRFAYPASLGRALVMGGFLGREGVSADEFAVQLEAAWNNCLNNYLVLMPDAHHDQIPAYFALYNLFNDSRQFLDGGQRGRIIQMLVAGELVDEITAALVAFKAESVSRATAVRDQELAKLSPVADRLELIEQEMETLRAQVDASNSQQDRLAMGGNPAAARELEAQLRPINSRLFALNQERKALLASVA